ncbi:MAG: hypothetical protein ACI9JL_000449 [Paracoccaceae bacterium]|jgi:uncharacterized protein (DUF2336 family)
MSSLLSGLMSLGRRQGGAMMEYDQAKSRAADPNTGARRKLAKRANVQPEILYFLAEDSDAGVRAEIAANPSTPVQADEVLSKDADDAVRERVAYKIAALAPELSAAERDRAGDIVTGILENLARDEAVKIRRVLSDSLKDAKGVPASVIEQLARDPDEAVCVPVLGNSPLLSDEFLVEIIESGPVRAALHAISGRHALGADVTDAIVATDDTDVITTLLSNKSAQIREETLDRIVDSAADQDAWHAPLVARPSLSARAGSALSRFVTEALLETLAARKDLDTSVTDAIGEGVRRRLGDAGVDSDDDEPASEKVRRLYAEQRLTESDVKAAMLRGDRQFVIEAIAVLGETAGPAVRKAFSLASAKGVAALSWKAGLSAELAHQLQLRLAKVSPSEAIKPRGGNYAMSEKDLAWQVEFFGG